MIKFYKDAKKPIEKIWRIKPKQPQLAKAQDKPVLDIDAAFKLLLKILNGKNCPTTDWRRKLR